MFSSPTKRMNILKDQNSLLSIAEEGKQTAALHASVVLHECFGPLSQKDRDRFFSGKQFQRWTTSLYETERFAISLKNYVSLPKIMHRRDELHYCRSSIITGTKCRHMQSALFT